MLDPRVQRFVVGAWAQNTERTIRDEKIAWYEERSQGRCSAAATVLADVPGDRCHLNLVS